MAAGSYLKAVWGDWLARMTGPLSLVLVFLPLVLPPFTARYLGGGGLVWIVSFLSLIVTTYRAWLSEQRARLAEKLDPLIEEVGELRRFWERIQHDHRDSVLIQFPLSGFDAEKWEEVHKQLLRLYFWTWLHAARVVRCLDDLRITERALWADVMNNQYKRQALDALGYSRLLEEHAAFLTRHRARITHRPQVLHRARRRAIGAPAEG